MQTIFRTFCHPLGSWPNGRRLLRRYRHLFLCLGALLLVSMTALPGWASSPTLMQFSGGGNSGSSYTLGGVGLDGYDIFQVAAPSTAIAQRRMHIHQNLETILDNYLDLENPVANVTTTENASGQPEVYVNGQYLMTITQEDANLQGVTGSGLVERLRQSIPRVLAQAYRERQPDYRQRQYRYIALAVALAIGVIVMLNLLSDRLLRWAASSLGATLDQDGVTEEQQHHLRDIRSLVLPVLQIGILLAVGVWALGRFPETRVIQQDLTSSLKVPVIIVIVALVAYIGVRLTYAVVDKLLMRLTDEEGFSGRYSRRTRLRISTLSSVIKNISNFVWIAIGFVLALTITGVNMGLLLASVGIIGLAISLAAQNLVQGAVRGFFIVLEDQFAIGDVVKIGDDAGIVENLNLRITQLRDTGGRLITIPTSDITRVANYSLQWSQSDLKIPVHYNADIDHMLDITRQVGEDMQNDPDWSDLILEEPKILGVDDFGDSAVIIRIWIKTQPMKQWDVSREYRRRFKLAVQESDTEIPFPQRDVWLHPSEELLVRLEGQLARPDLSEGDRDEYASNGRSSSTKSSRTDPQPLGVPEDSDSDLADADAEVDGDGDGK